MAATSEIRREGSPIAIVRDRQDITSSEDDIRLDDYLNDKLQTAADFEDLDSLIASVEEQRSQLQSQVCLPIFILSLANLSPSSKMRKPSSPAPKKRQHNTHPPFSPKPPPSGNNKRTSTAA